MRHQRYHLPLLAVCLFCLTSMGGCPNNVPAGQLTAVQGHVVNIRTGRPLPGVLVVLASDNRSTRSYNQVEDSVRTDLQGNYSLGFTNKAELYYAVICEGVSGYPLYPRYRFDFADSTYNNPPPFTGTTTSNLRTVDLVLGKRNQVKFRASPCRVWQVQVTTLVTRFQNLYFTVPASYFSTPVSPADNQRRSVTLYQSVPFTATGPQGFYQNPGFLPVAHFSRLLPNGTSQDTTVRLTPTTPLTGDTVQATLKFGR